MKPTFIKALGMDGTPYWVNVNNISLIQWRDKQGAAIALDVDAVNGRTFTLRIGNTDAMNLTGERNPYEK